MSNLRKKLAELYNGYDHEKEYIDAYKNPTLEEIQQLGNFIRGIVDSNGNIYVWNRNELLHQDAVTRLNIPDGIYFAIISGKMLISISPSISPDMFITYIQQAKNNFQFLNSNIEVKIDIGYYNVSNDNIYNHIETLNDIYDYNMSHAYATNKKRRLVKSYKKEY